MPGIEFRILGPLEVTVGGQPVHVGGAKHQVILGYLLTAKSRRASVSQLANAVWDSTPPATAEKQIRNAASDLRRILAPHGATITSSAGGYHLDIGQSSFDLDLFYAHLSRARKLLAEQEAAGAVTEFRSALDLWRGQVPAGIRSDQLLPRIAELNETRLSAVEEYFGLRLDMDQHRLLVGELAAWAGEYPLREHLVAQYIAALCRSGSRARAFDVYEQTRQRLADRLGISPGPELGAVYQQMLDDDPRSPVDGSRNRTRHLLRIVASVPVDGIDAARVSGLTQPTAEQIIEALVGQHMVLQPQAGTYNLHVLIEACCEHVATSLGEPAGRPTARSGGMSR
jgi:DNA-binding SARP family transcriptional activator